jgi:hypothetical protein
MKKLTFGDEWMESYARHLELFNRVDTRHRENLLAKQPDIDQEDIKSPIDFILTQLLHKCQPGQVFPPRTTETLLTDLPQLVEG